jgi:transcriptional regulator with XRE-family HTH domain
VNTNLRQQLLKKFGDKEYRDAFVAEQIYSRLPLKILALREDRELTQKELGEKVGMAQAWVSKLEDPNYGKHTISTLLKVASACDVALHVDFVPFSYILDHSITLDRESFSVPSYEQDALLWPAAVPATNQFVSHMASTFENWPSRLISPQQPISQSTLTSALEGWPLYLTTQQQTMSQATLTSAFDEWPSYLMSPQQTISQPTLTPTFGEWPSSLVSPQEALSQPTLTPTEYTNFITGAYEWWTQPSATVSLDPVPLNDLLQLGIPQTTVMMPGLMSHKAA